MMRIEVLKRLQEQSEAEADEVRQVLAQNRVTLINVMGSPGSGKTTLLEATLKRLTTDLKCAVLEGDLATLQDAERIADLGVPVAQLLTEGGCHLKPNLVHSALLRLDLSAIDCVFVENVGNLVCPANFDLGEHTRVVVLSVAEGDDKTSKYPYMFKQADAVVVSKLDLLPLCRFDPARTRREMHALNPKAAVFEISAVQETGLEAWVRWVHHAVEQCSTGLR
ncbi:MAG: hydrogenase nickel incorporation protein HypB [Phycisphaerae bacterium]|nr:hydrogenase nickel incorporation protein HypB [Phycisphaerae bacterium]